MPPAPAINHCQKPTRASALPRSTGEGEKPQTRVTPADSEQPMPCPSPGMNPYLEQDDAWHSFHERYCTRLADELVASTGPRYLVNPRAAARDPNPAGRPRPRRAGRSPAPAARHLRRRRLRPLHLHRRTRPAVARRRCHMGTGAGPSGCPATGRGVKRRCLEAVDRGRHHAKYRTSPTGTPTSTMMSPARIDSSNIPGIPMSACLLPALRTHPARFTA